jgi:uncharacterized membrane protein
MTVPPLKTATSMMRTLVLVTLAVLAALGCGSADRDQSKTTRDSAAPVQEPPGLLRGLVLVRSGAPHFVPCGRTDTLPLTAAPGVLAELQARAASPFFVVAAGSSNRQVALDRLLYASPNRFECHADWSGFTYRATGHDPGWVAEVVGDTVILRREGDQTFRWTGARTDSTAAAVRIAAPAAGGTPVELTLQPRACRNAAARSYSAWTATLLLGAERLSGCAVPGLH